MDQQPEEGTDLRQQLPFRIGPWLVEPSLNRLSAPAETIQLEPRLMRVLECLALQPGRVVSRDEILERVWGDVVVGEEALTVSICQLRRILGDDARTPRYIETIHKGGYRLVAELTSESAGTDGTTTADRRWFMAAAVAVLVVVAAFAIRMRMDGTAKEASPPPMLQGRPLTSTPGGERYPAISPDGTRVAYSWQGDIHITQPGSNAILQLTGHDDVDSYPAWSPEGDRIAFVRHSEPVAIHIVSALGGITKKVAEVDPLVAGLDWSPDGRWLTFSSSTDPELPYLILLHELATGELHHLTHPQPEFACDSFPAFSPGGDKVAFVRSGYGPQQDIFLISVEGGEARQLTWHQRRISGLDWTADGTAIVFAGAPTGRFSLWRVSATSGEVGWLPTTGGEVRNPSLSAMGTSLVYEASQVDRDIWALSLQPAAAESVEAQPIIDSTRLDLEPRISPDGRSILFVSDRSGSLNLWMSDRDGCSPRRLTDFEGLYPMGPRFSPDGKLVAFTADPGGHSTVFVLELDGGTLRGLSSGGVNEIFAAWSPDGRWLYYSRDRGENWETWRIGVDGEGASRVNERGPGIIAVTDEALYCLPGAGSGILRVSLNNGSVEEVLGCEVVNSWGNVTVAGTHLFAFERTSRGWRLVSFDLESRKIEEVLPAPLLVGRDLNVAPDLRTALFARLETNESDLMLAELPGRGHHQ